MTLPAELSRIFIHKQKSYKMVLILALLNEMKVTGKRKVSFTSVKEQFLAHFREREAAGANVDLPPEKLAARWRQVSQSQVGSVIDTPIQALSEILEFPSDRQTMGFKRELFENWDPEVLTELHDYATKELENYYRSSTSAFSLNHALQTVLYNYLKAKTEPLGGHSLGTFVRQTIPGQLAELSFIHEYLKVQGSVGQGNWATIPWIAIMDRRITETTQQGEYIVYLFSDDMSAVYLTLAQGVTVPIRDKGKVEGYKYLRQKVREMRDKLPLIGMTQDENILLTSGGIGQDYQVSTVAYYRYEAGKLPEDKQILKDLHNLVDNYQQYVESKLGNQESANHKLEVKPAVDSMPPKSRLVAIKRFIQSKGFTFPEFLIGNFFLSLKSKPFVILAGVSGTGKTKLVKLFAEALGATSENGQFTLIPVRPDWSDPSDLLGYKDLSGAFRPGPLTQVLVEAARPENREKPYFVCLDEMNLARVEHYFSDLLSVLETQEWRDERIVTAPVIRMSSLAMEKDKQQYGDLSVPDNVYLIGTVNMDETTHPFSKKVLDRANTIEFNYIDLHQFPDNEKDLNDNGATASAPNSFLRSDYLQLVDVYRDHKELIRKTTENLVRINTILESIHSHVGFRIRDAVCFFLIYNERFQLMNLDAAFDVQLLQKVLPRIQGSSLSVKRALLQLMQEALGEKLVIQNLLDDASELYVESDRLTNAKYPLSAKKLAFMVRRLEEDGFTSYWLT